jgi:hypothetical protein
MTNSKEEIDEPGRKIDEFIDELELSDENLVKSEIRLRKTYEQFKEIMIGDVLTGGFLVSGFLLMIEYSYIPDRWKFWIGIALTIIGLLILYFIAIKSIKVVNRDRKYQAWLIDKLEDLVKEKRE